MSTENEWSVPEESERWLSKKPPRTPKNPLVPEAADLDFDELRAAGFPPYDNGFRWEDPTWTPMRVIPGLDHPPAGATWRTGNLWLDDDGNEVPRHPAEAAS